MIDPCWELIYSWACNNCVTLQNLAFRQTVAPQWGGELKNWSQAARRLKLKQNNENSRCLIFLIQSWGSHVERTWNSATISQDYLKQTYPERPCDLAPCTFLSHHHSFKNYIKVWKILNTKEAKNWTKSNYSNKYSNFHLFLFRTYPKT